jgi:hypothetical protein
MLKYRSPKDRGRLRIMFAKLATAIGLVLMVAMTAGAYTLVLRDGRRLEIPDEFTVTRNTLTYEIGPGFNKTMLVTLIDVAATERANSEAPGTFFKHKEEPPVPATPTIGPAVRTVTNLDLAAARKRRIESEQAYEARRKELGLPTVEESRRRQEAEEVAFRERSREESMSKAREESYWRQRARDLRSEIATVDTQISYLRGRVSDLNESMSANRSWTTGVYPIYPNRPWLGNGWPNQRLPRNR